MFRDSTMHCYTNGRAISATPKNALGFQCLIFVKQKQALGDNGNQRWFLVCGNTKLFKIKAKTENK